MKKLAIFLIFLPNIIVLGATNSFSPGDMVGVVSTSRSNIMVVLQYPFEGTPGNYTSATLFPSKKRIPIGFCSTTNRYYEIFRLTPEYGFRISANSQQTGESVSYTSLGLRCGSKFDELRGYNKDVLDWSAGSTGENRPFWSIASQKPPMYSFLPAPEDLFKFDQPGIYIIKIEYQCLARESPPISTNLYPVRFPPIELRIQKD